MVVKKIPMRTCVVTREQFPKMELIRVLRTPEGTVTIDGVLPEGKKSMSASDFIRGRGVAVGDLFTVTK